MRKSYSICRLDCSDEKSVMGFVGLFGSYLREFQIHHDAVPLLQFWTGILSQGGITVFTANAPSNKPHGFIVCENSYTVVKISRAITLRDLYVLPSSRRGGLGTALIMHSKYYAEGHGFSTIFISAENKHLNFYKKLGWAEMHEKSLMRLEL